MSKQNASNLVPFHPGNGTGGTLGTCAVNHFQG